MDTVQLVEIITGVLSFLGFGGAGTGFVLVKKKNASLNERVAKLEAYQDANHQTITRIDNKLDELIKYFMKKGGK